jgi:hypothetical protein
MRAACEACGRPQPVDWRPGDLCVHCGQPVRREVRCFWCTRLVPAAKFCRRCGAAVIEAAQYGAARMLKDAGADRFTIPKMLVELDPDQIETFTRIYQQHAGIAAHHVDQFRFLESCLEQNGWSDELDERLAAEMPCPTNGWMS